MTKAEEQAEKIAALERELAGQRARIADLERAKPRPAPSEAEMARHRDEMHRLRERNASQIPDWLQRECAGGVTDADAQGIVRARHAPQGPSAQCPSSQTLTGARPGGGPANVPGSGTGWAWEIPLGPPPGTRWVDRQLDAQDAKDRHERMVEEARRQAMLKAAEQP